MASPNTIAAKLHEAARGRTSLFPQIIHSGPWAIGFTQQGAGNGVDWLCRCRVDESAFVPVKPPVPDEDAP